MSEQPNILLVISDQMIAALTGAYGHPVVKTPALERLCGEGIRFDAAYTPYPLCAPARACLMSGRYASVNGCIDNGAPLREDLPTVGAVFAAGDIDYSTFRLVASRTTLIDNQDVMAAVDTALAAALLRWRSLSRGLIRARVDRIVARHDRDAVRRAMGVDKKTEGGTLRWVLLEGVGRAVLRSDVPQELVESALDEVA